MATPWRPEIPDRGGRGEICRVIHKITKELSKVRPGGAHEDKTECARLLHRLDKERDRLKTLYPGVTPTQED